MPVMITLNKISTASPYVDGWKEVFEAHKHLGMDTPFPLSRVLDLNGLEDALLCFEVLPEHIKIPKRFALWCARDVQHLMTDEYTVNTLDIVERYIDGNITLEELKAAYTAYADDPVAYADDAVGYVAYAVGYVAYAVAYATATALAADFAALTAAAAYAARAAIHAGYAATRAGALVARTAAADVATDTADVTTDVEQKQIDKLRGMLDE